MEPNDPNPEIRSTPRRGRLRTTLIVASLPIVICYGVIHHISNGQVSLFLEKTYEAISTGTLDEQVDEWLASYQEQEVTIELGEQIEVPNTFMANYTNRIDLYLVGMRNNIAFLEVGNNVGIVERGAEGEFVTIPAPQHDRSTNQYILPTQANINGEIQTSGEQLDGYGGVVLDKGGIRVGFPGDFPDSDAYTSFDELIVGENSDAIISYFAVIDSYTADSDVAEISEIRGLAGKRVANSPEFSSMITTYYLRDGSYVTVIGSSFRQPDLTTGEYNPTYVNDYTIPQLYSLAEQYGQQRFGDDLERIMTAFPDPGPSMSMIEGMPIILDDANHETYAPFILDDENPGPWYATYGGNASAAGKYSKSVSFKPFSIVLFPVDN